jgi:hypothetical protein
VGSSAFLEWGWRNLDVTSVTAMIAPANIASIRLAERLGFTLRIRDGRHISLRATRGVTVADVFSRPLNVMENTVRRGLVQPDSVGILPSAAPKARSAGPAHGRAPRPNRARAVASSARESAFLATEPT